MSLIEGIPIRDSIHTDFSTGFSAWAEYRSVLTGNFVSGGGVLSGRYGEFTKDIQEYNRKADTLTGAWGDRNDTGLFLGPFNAGFRYTGTGDFVTYSREIDPLDLNPYLYFLGSEGVTTAGGAVSAWSQVSAGSNQLSTTLAQGTADYQPDNATEESIDFDGSDDKLAFDVAVAQAGILIVGTSNGCFAYEVDADSVDEITALGFETGFFKDLDLFAYVLLPTTATDAEVSSVIKYLVEEKGATKNPTGNLENYFRSRTDLVTPKFDALDFSGVTSLSYTWPSSSSITSFPFIDTSSVTNFSTAWFGLQLLTSFPKLDTSSGTNFFQTWASCRGLTSFPLMDFSSATFLYSSWYNCSGLTSFPLLDLSSGTNFTNTWRGCTQLESFLALDLSSGTDFPSCWRYCSSLTEFPVLDLSSGTNFSYAWGSCSSLTEFPVLDLSSGTNFSQCWYGCTGLTSFPASIDLSSGTDFGMAWYGCNNVGFTSFPAGIDLSSGTSFSATWMSCWNLTSFPALDLSSGTYFGQCWRGLNDMVSFGACTFSTSVSYSLYLAWAECNSMTSFPTIDLSKANNCKYAWYACHALTSFPALDISSCTTFWRAWWADNNIVTFGACIMDKGQTFEGAWYQNTSLTTFPAGVFDDWNPASVTDNCFVNAWDSCNSLTATSVENILNSLATAGVAAPSSGVDITIDFDDTSGTPDISSAVTTLKGLSPAWTITLNGVAQ